MNLGKQLRPILAFALVGALAQIAQAQDEQVTRMRTALAAPERAAENKDRDASRKPIETVQFLGIKTGATAIDMIAARIHQRLQSRPAAPQSLTPAS